jgi:hypothetical protein
MDIQAGNNAGSATQAESAACAAIPSAPSPTAPALSNRLWDNSGYALSPPGRF